MQMHSIDRTSSRASSFKESCCVSCVVFFAFQEETVFTGSKMFTVVVDLCSSRLHHSFINHKIFEKKLKNEMKSFKKTKSEQILFKKINSKMMLSARQPFDRLHLNVNDEINGHRFFFLGSPQRFQFKYTSATNTRIQVNIGLAWLD